jgi:hypothetical protein
MEATVMFETKRIEGQHAKITITADGVVRVKIPRTYSVEDEAKVQAFFASIVSAAPKLDKTLRGELNALEHYKGDWRSMTLHTGTSKSSIVKYQVRIE